MGSTRFSAIITLDYMGREGGSTSEKNGHVLLHNLWKLPKLLSVSQEECRTISEKTSLSNKIRGKLKNSEISEQMFPLNFLFKGVGNFPPLAFKG